jgi:phosphatidylinositol N-acetylglucosaminyltransferase subunit P
MVGMKGRIMGEGRSPRGTRHLKDWKKLWIQGTDADMDVPSGSVCEVLYGEFGDVDSEEEVVS